MKLSWEQSVSSKELRTLAVTDSGLLVAGGREMALLAADGQPTPCKAFLSHNIYSTLALTGHTDLLAVAGCQDGNIHFLGKELTAIPHQAHPKTVNSIAVFKNRLVTGSWDGTFRVWNHPVPLE
jgi:hypothetical protein